MAFQNVGVVCDLIETYAGSAGVNKSKINRRFLWDLVSLKGIELARRSGFLSKQATITTTADQDLYEKPESVLYIKDVRVEEVPATKTTRGDIMRLRDSNSGVSTTTDGTITSWLYWQENRGANGYIGIADARGTAPAVTGYEVEIYYSTMPDRIDSDNLLLGFHDKWVLPFVKSLAAEVLRVNGVVNALSQSYDFEWERLIAAAIHDAVDSEFQPLIQYPLNLSINE